MIYGGEEKNEVYEYLVNINGVESVDYDETEEYNKDNHTLYVVNVDDVCDSKLATDVFNEITEHFEDYQIYTSGDISDRNVPVLSPWIIVLAVACALVILIIMCESYVEPFLFLTAILMAVILNSGTNIIFGTVSNITSSIAAILQMALSMDYSIMLMNRYDDEKKVEKDKIVAMKNALFNAFKAISSSSVTTIVGLLALVFMSFTIGRDLGLVLAKGVLFSLLTIFFVLPTLILIFDKWIEKTKKKSPNFKMDFFGKVSYKIRRVAPILFVAVFIGSALLKGNLDITYSDTGDDELAAVFPEKNQMVLIYDNDDEAAVTEYIAGLEDEEKVDTVLGYGNTIGEELKYDELLDQLTDLSDEDDDLDVEDYLLKIIYYNYYNPDEQNTMTFNEFVEFIKNDITENKEVNEQLDDDTRSEVDRLYNFTNTNLINKKRSASDIANILEIDKQDVDDILVYYNSKNNINITIGISDFIDFMYKDVLTNETYSEDIDDDTRDSLDTLKKFTNKTTLQTKVNYKQMASLFDMEESSMKNLYLYYITQNDIDTKLTLAEFADFVLNDVLNDSEYADRVDSDTKDSVETLQKFTNKTTISKNMKAKELADLFDMDEDAVEQLLLLKYMEKDNGSKMTIPELLENIEYLEEHTSYLDGVNLEALSSLEMYMTDEEQDDITLSKMFGVDVEIVDNVMAGVSQQVGANVTKLSPSAFAEALTGALNSQKEELEDNLNDVNIALNGDGTKENPGLYNSLNALNSQIEAAGGETNVDADTLAKKAQLEEGIETAEDNKDKIEAGIKQVDESIASLKTLQKLMDTSTKYTATEFVNLAKTLGTNVSKSQMYQLYALVDYENGNTKNWKATPMELVDLILDNLDNDEVADNIDDDTVDDLELVKKIMKSAKNDTKYTYAGLADFLDMDSGDTKDIYGLYVSKKGNTTMNPQQFVNFVLSHQHDEELEDEISSDDIEDLELLQDVMQGVMSGKKYSTKELSDLLGIDEDSVELLYGLYYSRYVSPNQRMSLRDFVRFILNDVMNNPDYSDNFDKDTREQLDTIDGIMTASLNGTKYNRGEIFSIITRLTDDLESDMVDLLYIYYGSEKEYNEDWTMTVEEFVNYINDTILTDSKFDDFIEDDMREQLADAKEDINDAKDLLIGENYSRVILSTLFDEESDDTHQFIQKIKDDLSGNLKEFYIIGDSPMAYEMSLTFQDELNMITIITMFAIFIVVAVTFKSILVPLILVFMIQTAVYMIMTILSLTGSSVYFIALLIVQSILMGATIDYAILYTSFYMDYRKTYDIKDSIIKSYNSSIHTIMTSATILIVVTLIISGFTSAMAGRICLTISQGTLCSELLILLLLPAVLAGCDKIIMRKNKKSKPAKNTSKVLISSEK